MIIRNLTQKDIREHDKVSSQSFVYPCDINDKSSHLPCNKMSGAFDDDNKTLFADFEINEKKCYFHNTVLSCAAIGGVISKPEHRGKGAVKALFNNLFENGNYDISILYPFSDGYYRNLGYEPVGKSIKLTVPFNDLYKIPKNTDCILFENNNIKKLPHIYNKCARQYNLCFLRENCELFSDNPYLSQKFTYIYKENGYVTYSLNRETETVNVFEIMHDSAEALEGILGFLRNFESNYGYIHFEKLPYNSPVLLFIENSKRCKTQIYNTGSARIINFENVLKSADYKNMTGEFTIKIGNENFNVLFSDGNTAVNKNSEKTPQIITDIPSASKLILEGVENPRICDYFRNTTVNDYNSDFFKIFTYKNPFFTDEF